MVDVAPLPAKVVSFLKDDDRVERCPAYVAYAMSVVASVITEEAEDTLHAAAQDRWAKANTYSYDGARKSVEAWLLASGWRVRAATGAHAAVGKIVDSWLADAPHPGPRIARTFSASRKARHDDEYPSPTTPNRNARELRALVLDNARLINEVRRQFGLDAVADIVATEEVLEQRPER